MSRKQRQRTKNTAQDVGNELAKLTSTIEESISNTNKRMEELENRLEVLESKKPKRSWGSWLGVLFWAIPFPAALAVFIWRRLVDAYPDDSDLGKQVLLWFLWLAMLAVPLVLIAIIDYLRFGFASRATRAALVWLAGPSTAYLWIAFLPPSTYWVIFGVCAVGVFVGTTWTMVNRSRLGRMRIFRFAHRIDEQNRWFELLSTGFALCGVTAAFILGEDSGTYR